jgi:choline dehydrogenase-like flavoprotein
VTRTIHAQVCVIGSGPGGAPVACRLAQAGVDVVVVEEGARLDLATAAPRPIDAFTDLYRDGGQTVAVGTPSIPIPLGRVVGGTSAINSGTCLRPTDAVLDGWADGLGLEELRPVALSPYLDEAARVLGVTRVPPEIAGRNAHLAKRGADRMGWPGAWLPRNAPGCRGSGRCVFGCPTGAKRHAGLAWIDDALAAGARLLDRTRVLRIEAGGGRNVVHARSDGGAGLRIVAERVVVGCGSLLTPGLLRRSGLAVGNPHLGRHLAIHPATAAAARFDDELPDVHHGVPQSYGVDAFADRGVVLEGIGGPPEYLAFTLPLRGDAHQAAMRDHRRWAQFGMMISDRPVGRVLDVGAGPWRRSIVRYDLHPADREAIRFGIERLAELWFAAGAREVLVPVAGLPPLRDGDLRPLREHPLPAASLRLMAFHPHGSVRPSADPRDGVLDPDLRVRGTGGVYVSDASALPATVGVNPQLTITALALRLARHLLDQPAPSRRDAAAAAAA